MKFDCYKFILFMFYAGLFAISMFAINRIDSKHDQKLNNTDVTSLADSMLASTSATPFNFESKFNCLTDDGRDFIKQYKYNKAQEKRNLSRKENDLIVENTMKVSMNTIQ